MANLEDSHDVDLDAILGELCALENAYDREIQARGLQSSNTPANRHSDSQPSSHYDPGGGEAGGGGRHSYQHHHRSLSEASSSTTETSSTPGSGSSGGSHAHQANRTDSPDNDSAFSDTVSLLSGSESSASSGGGGVSAAGAALTRQLSMRLQGMQQDEASRLKAEKIRMAMEKIKEANIQKLFLKVFTIDGSAKSLLVDEKMLSSYVTRLLADKNHVQMDPKWGIVEHLPDLYMERFYEDHENLVDNLLLWTRDSKNKIYFVEREDKIKLFLQPEKFLLASTDKKDNSDFDEHSRNMLLEEFFSSTSLPDVEGPLYLKADSKKGWKKYHFVLRASGLYYFPKDKVKSAKDLVCLATFDNNHMYYGLGWKKKYKAPTDYCFAIKHPRLQEPKSTKYIKYLCAEDQATLERWMVGMRIAKFGKQLMDNYRSLMDELAQEDLDILAHARSCSVSSIAVQSMTSNVTTPTQGYPGSEAGYGTQSDTYSAPSDLSSGRHSRASSSSSSGCMSDGAPSSCENAFESEFPMGTIKRKPSMKPSLPLTNITRQLKEVGETRDETDDVAIPSSPALYTNTGTLTRCHSRRKSNHSSHSSDDSSSTGTLKRHNSYKSRGSVESMSGRSGNSTPLCGTPIRERASPFGERNSPFSEKPSNDDVLRNSVSSPTNMDSMPSCMMDSITSLPPPPEVNGDIILPTTAGYQLPPPPSEVYDSNLSLDSLPPPPAPGELPPVSGSDLTGSQLSLMSLPPPPPPHEYQEDMNGTIKRRKGSITPTNPLSPQRSVTACSSPDRTPTQSRLNTPVHSPPQSVSGSSCSTPVQPHPPQPSVNGCYAQQQRTPGQNHDRNGEVPIQPPAYVNPPLYRPQSSTLPANTSFNQVGALRSSLRQVTLPRQISSTSIASSTNSSASSGNTSINSYSTEHSLQKKEPTSPKSKSGKKISFNLTPQEVPPLPKKPPPPKRAETTKLSSPKKLADPPTDFLKDLQRVMRKKWQVAQKCKLEPETTPHEVLGFRDPPALLPDYKEHNVSNWVKEHYGTNNLYENVYRDEDCPPSTPQQQQKQKRPPPPPPKRSETTQLSKCQQAQH
ncbi:unnamed protein product [Acanthoscelides obtectus]|nr:unnamed protein product [Acanthoscelides obtectus]CAK1633844.1 Amyloid beta A4 precursor protein-binding family B member 1-interacting protein [Acanthoscelides obtectus]